jgi:RNA methyltransferase, TrmH family
VITSTANSRVKQLRALRQRKERDATGLFLAEGIRIVGEAAELDAPVVEVVVAPDLLSSDHGKEIARVLTERGVPTFQVSAEVFRWFSGKERPQGLAAVIRQHWEPLDALDPSQESIMIVLDRIQDPGNLGTILRTADATGASGVILVGSTTDPYDPTAVRAGMGAIVSQYVVRATVPEIAVWKGRHAVPFVGTSDSATIVYDLVEYAPPLVLLMGSEQHGLDPALLELCDRVVRIPMAGRSDSLNLAVATGVMLYEIARQRRSRSIS